MKLISGDNETYFRKLSNLIPETIKLISGDYVVVSKYLVEEMQSILATFTTVAATMNYTRVLPYVGQEPKIEIPTCNVYMRSFYLL